MDNVPVNAPEEKQKFFSFSKDELSHLEPINAVLQALNAGLQDFIIRNVYPRLGFKPTQMSRFDVAKGILWIPENDNPPAGSGTPAPETPKANGQPEAKPKEEAKV